jgi:hypothetical protein
MTGEPRTSRPHMPGYGIRGPDEGTGLLPWSWAVERLTASHDYWVATSWPAGRPHVMPVWGVWFDDAVWFSSSLRSRKALNLAADPRCTITTDDPLEPVVVDGTATLVGDRPTIQAFADKVNAKYDTSYGLDFFDPAINGCYRVDAERAFGVTSADFEGSPTRWTFG